MDTSLEPSPYPPPERRVYPNRTLNLRAVKAIGFDMDYTLVHYRHDVWENEAYHRARQALENRGWPVSELLFDPAFVTLGLILDLQLGNIVKANRFGYVTRACHGTRMLEFEEQRAAYSRVLVSLDNPRWVPMDTLFSLSEASLFAQLVDLLDAGRLETAIGYADLHRIVRQSVDEVHMMGALKEEIIADPDRFVELDPELPLALLDLKHAGKKLIVVTNSEWHYARAMLSYVIDRFMPNGKSWRDLFDLVIVGARKPVFFTTRNPIFEIVDDSGLLRPYTGKLRDGHVYLGGDARVVERDLGLSGEEILYVGDHIYADVHVSKDVLRWRTALVVRALEEEIGAVERFKERQAELTRLMEQKARREHRYAVLRRDLQRLEVGYAEAAQNQPDELRKVMATLRAEVAALDARIAPLAQESGELVNPRWGPLLRAGNDKSHLARQIERSADVYMSRVSNLLYSTPFVYLRAPRGSLPHDSSP
jgi:HAD superfamily 5'-nucleotidase-like hydrolase